MMAKKQNKASWKYSCQTVEGVKHTACRPVLSNSTGGQTYSMQTCKMSPWMRPTELFIQDCVIGSTSGQPKLQLRVKSKVGQWDTGPYLSRTDPWILSTNDSGSSQSSSRRQVEDKVQIFTSGKGQHCCSCWVSKGLHIFPHRLHMFPQNRLSFLAPPPSTLEPDEQVGRANNSKSSHQGN